MVWNDEVIAFFFHLHAQTTEGIRDDTEVA